MSGFVMVGDGGAICEDGVCAVPGSAAAPSRARDDQATVETTDARGTEDERADAR